MDFYLIFDAAMLARFMRWSEVTVERGADGYMVCRFAKEASKPTADSQRGA